jgi:nitroreductase
MDALTALHSRVSVSRLSEPVPDQQALRNIYRAALRAADHALLRPWRFLLIEGASLQRLGDLFVAASLSDNPDLTQEKQHSICSKALRAPLIVVAVTSPKPHPNVPEIEQEYSTAAAIQNMLNAAHAQAIGAIWRTGPMAVHLKVREGLGLSAKEKITGFLYLGQISVTPRPPQELPIDDYFSRW